MGVPTRNPRRYHSGVPQHPLVPRVLAASWLLALAAWPVAWALGPAAQGLGTVVAGGSWIGLAVPLGATPWGLVNEPGIAFAASRAALLSYWLPPLLLPALLALALPVLVPGGSGWCGELFRFQLGAALAAATLGWGAPLTRPDGAAGGLATFWRVPPLATIAVAVALGAVGAALSALRLAGQLWHAPGGPTRQRRWLLVVLHLGVPAAGWVSAVRLLGWPIQWAPCLGISAVVVGTLLAVTIFVPRSPLRRPAPLRLAALLALALAGGVVAGTAAWAGSPAAGQGKAILWGRERATSNLRPGLVPVHITPHRVPTVPRGSSAGGS